MVTLTLTNDNYLGSVRPIRIIFGRPDHYTTLSLATDAFPLNIGFIAAYADKVFREVKIDPKAVQICR